VWKDKVLAESEGVILVEGKHYFPPESIKKEYFRQSRTHIHAHGKEQPVITIQ
jgi:uncharacterized protein (DUF427 family)